MCDSMKISVIIPTYKRPEKLERLLNLLLRQSYLPDEILVVDSAADNLTKEVVSNFQRKKILFKYIVNNIDSISVARNLGASNSMGDYLIFLDDDDCPDSTYIGEIMNCFSRNSNALLVQGNIVKNKSSKTLKNIFWDNLWNNYNRFFLLFRYTQCEKKVLASGKTTFPIDCDHDVNCQWASGGVTCIKREVFDDFNFDEKLVKYCYGEDADFSFRIHKSNPKSVYMASKAKLTMFPSMNIATPAKESIIMEKTYSLYFVSKNLGSISNFLFFIWSEIGTFVKDIVFCILFFKNNGRYYFYRLVYSLYAFLICIKHFQKIKNLDIEYINKRYLT